ncbi:unnamed protein product [Urochloa humidicola]
MSSSLPASSTTKITTTTTATTTRSLFALALRAWNLCVILVVVAAFLLVSPAAVVILLPVACMAVSLCLLCSIAARILLPFFVPLAGEACDDEHEHRSGGVRERKQDCVEVDRAEAPGGLDEDTSSAEGGNWGDGAEQEHGTGFSSLDEELSDPCGDEQRRFYFVDTGGYYTTFYDLLAFWRSVEREGDSRQARRKKS